MTEPHPPPDGIALLDELPWWCRTCGIVAARPPGRPPLCRHNLLGSRGPAATRMVPLPAWHPMAVRTAP